MRQAGHVHVLRGLSTSQAKEVESLVAKAEVLQGQLRDVRAMAQEINIRHTLRENCLFPGITCLKTLCGRGVPVVREVDVLSDAAEITTYVKLQERRKSREQANKRVELKGLKLSTDFTLEQELFAERYFNAPDDVV